MSALVDRLMEIGNGYPNVLLLAAAKITGALAAAWLMHYALKRANPRWRVLVWRFSAVGIVLLAGLAVGPPLVELPMLPSPPTSDGGLTTTVPNDVEGATGKTLAPPNKLPGAAGPPVGPALAEADRPLMTPAERRADVRQSATKMTTRPATERPRSWLFWMAAIWLGGVLIGTGRNWFGLRRVARIRRQATAVPERVSADAARIAAGLGVRLAFELRESREICTPCLSGVWRPMILLPANQCDAEFAAELPSILAHELAHLRGRDLVWNALLANVAILLWFHPLAWRMRLAHADACDEVSDAIAADYAGDARHYGCLLARLAVRTSGPAMAAGLAMARPSGVRRRVEAIQRHVFRYRLPWRRAVVTVAVATCAYVLLGGLALTSSVAESPQAPAVAAKPAVERMTIRASADKSGEPLADVQLRFAGRIGGERIDRYLKTDRDGVARLEWKKGGRVEDLWMTAKKPTLVPIHYVWSTERREVELPDSLELRFQPGIAIGGVVRDEAGQPIASAKVELRMPITWPRLASYVFTAADLHTGADGRWQFDGAPADVGSIGISAEHPDYMRAGASATRSMDNITVLKQGLRVVGHVVDQQLNPVVGAMAALGFDRFGSDDPETRTDDEGQFVLKNCKPGRSLVTIQADGFSPLAKEIVVGEQEKDMLLMLEPGHTMRGRVADIDGKPVKGALFGADTWRGYRSLKFRVDTPEDGRVVWRGAPPDSVLYDIVKTGYMASRQVAIKPDGDEYVVTLHPVLEISGRVTDARTGEPIKQFQVTHGYQFANSTRTYWDQDEGIACTDGRYTYKFDEPMKGYLLQVVASGYRSATSRLFETTEGKVTYDFALESGEGPTGVVLLPDGRPAAGAHVGRATREKHAMLDMGRFDRSQNQAEVVETGADGRFSFIPHEDQDFLLLVLHDAGYAQVTGEELQKDQEIRLQPWGRIEGRVLIGDKPDANREVNYQPAARRADGRSMINYVFSWGYETNTDSDGRFAFERVMPGPGSVSRVVITEFLRTWQHAPGWHQSIEVRPGETAQVTIGGTGRPVTGRIVLDRDPGVEIDWTTNEPAAIQAWDREKGQRGASHNRFLGNLDKSGRFEIPDVPAGEYKLTVAVNNPPVPNACGAGDAIGRAELAFSVPEMPGGRSDEPLDVGDVKAELFDTLDVGELAPDFVAERLDGGRARLSELRGKLVLLDFWATWCAPCVAEMPTLKEIQQQHGDDPRFVLLSVSCDNDAAAAKKFVEENALAWQHVRVDGTAARVPKDFTVRALPATFLIGPDGRVIAKNVRGEELQRAVAAALGDDKLFRAGNVERPPRFPVFRFEAPADPQPSNESAAVVVADDCDPNFEKDRPHTDGLRLLTAKGDELWSASGLNNCQTVGGVHGVAVDRRRGRVYVRELVSRRILAFSRGGQKLWQIEGVDADALLVDERTGNVWVSGGPQLNDGETVVFDPRGNELAAYPFRGVDMAYSPHDDAFWLVGYEILKLSRGGEVQFRKPVDGWCCASVSVNPADGSVWIAEREHPDVARSKNRLWLLTSDGSVRQEIDLGKDDVFVVESDPKSGDAWFGGYNRGLRRATPAGELSEPIAVQASNIAISPTTGDLWVTTGEAVLKLDGTGAILTKVPHRTESRQAWLAAF